MKKLSHHRHGLLEYLRQPFEKANEDLVLSFFRSEFATFTRQSDAKGADGYVAGNFVLELKGDPNDWFRGLLQGLAYNRELDFSLIVVAAKGFLGIWRIDDLSEEIRTAVRTESGSPHAVGRSVASRFKSEKHNVLRTAAWRLREELIDGLFAENQQQIEHTVDELLTVLRTGAKKRIRITPKNFTRVLAEARTFFDEDHPTAAVRAFYNVLFGWDEGAKLLLSQKKPDQATLNGELIEHLRPGKRQDFKEFVERHAVVLGRQDSYDDFFASYDRALDTVDPDFRRKNGIFFTDLDLSRFVMWQVKTHLGQIGKDYLVIDPACGSGNLVTNWRSPLELRHKVVSEIEPELLFAVERRMRTDTWHEGRFTVVPRVSEGKGLNFLDKSADEYLETIQHYLNEKGQKANRPIAFLCNPPYRSDDDQAAEAVSYAVHPSILELTGKDASAERYCCFLAQMKLICAAAEKSGLPGESLILVFTKAAWLADRPVFEKIQREMLRSFELVGGSLFDSRQFFDVKGKFPVAFTLWRYMGENARLDERRSIQLMDLTWIRKSDLEGLPWNDAKALDERCNEVVLDDRSLRVAFTSQRPNIREWTGEKRYDFQREKTKAETKDVAFQCGLPAGDRRHARKKTLGHAVGPFVGFMDDLTPCRVNRATAAVPYFHLDTRFMRVRKYRCFSGPADNRSFFPSTETAVERLFVWFALGKCFADVGYPLWADAFELWPVEQNSSWDSLVSLAFAIGYAENECVAVRFPANNPMAGSPEVTVKNPMGGLEIHSFWNRRMRARVSAKSSAALSLVTAVDDVFNEWSKRFKAQPVLHVNYSKPYLIGATTLELGAGLLQIRDYARHHGDLALETRLAVVAEKSRAAKNQLVEMLRDSTQLNYFGAPSRGETISASQLPLMEATTAFEEALLRRVLLASTIVDRLSTDPHLGRTKLAKVFHLADTMHHLDLRTKYERQAAGPLDVRAFYNARIGVEFLSQKHGYFSAERAEGDRISYSAGPNMSRSREQARVVLGEKLDHVHQLIARLAPLDTDQTEIVSTLFACWNDLLQARVAVTDDLLVSNFTKWSDRKKRFSIRRIKSALSWMRTQGIVPVGKAPKTLPLRSK